MHDFNSMRLQATFSWFERDANHILAYLTTTQVLHHEMQNNSMGVSLVAPHISQDFSASNHPGDRILA
jgi:hypothetical protein